MELPRALGVVEFVTARAQEVQQLASGSLAFAKQGSGNRRVYQLLPRTLRRRTMAHNVHRLPPRLREQARREMSRMGSKPLNHKHIRCRAERRRPTRALLQFFRRSQKLRWLETHLWLAKRMHMSGFDGPSLVELKEAEEAEEERKLKSSSITPASASSSSSTPELITPEQQKQLARSPAERAKSNSTWGFRLPLRPHDKSQRASLRHSTKHCSLFDASYYTCLELCGSVERILEVMDNILDPQSRETLRGARSGSRDPSSLVHREIDIDIYAPKAFPLGLIGPARALWTHPPCYNREEEISTSSSSSAAASHEVLWLWLHPAMVGPVSDHLRAFAGRPSETATVDKINKQQKKMSKRAREDGLAEACQKCREAVQLHRTKKRSALEQMKKDAKQLKKKHRSQQGKGAKDGQKKKGKKQHKRQDARKGTRNSKGNQQQQGAEAGDVPEDAMLDDDDHTVGQEDARSPIPETGSSSEESSQPQLVDEEAGLLDVEDDLLFSGRGLRLQQLQQDLCRLELRGGKSHLVLMEVLRPLGNPDILVEAWRQLQQLQTPVGVIPEGAVLRLQVQDPRSYSTTQPWKSLLQHAPTAASQRPLSGAKVLKAVQSISPEAAEKLRLVSASTQSFPKVLVSATASAAGMISGQGHLDSSGKEKHNDASAPRKDQNPSETTAEAGSDRGVEVMRISEAEEAAEQPKLSSEGLQSAHQQKQFWKASWSGEGSDLFSPERRKAARRLSKLRRVIDGHPSITSPPSARRPKHSAGRKDRTEALTAEIDDGKMEDDCLVGVDDASEFWSSGVPLLLVHRNLVEQPLQSPFARVSSSPSKSCRGIISIA